MNMVTAKESGKREMVEKWMKEHEVVILAIQETKINQNIKEARKEYTWFFS